MNRADAAGVDCIICCENTATVTFQPCGHKITCTGNTSVPLFVCLSICLSACLYVFLCVNLSVCVCRCVCMSFFGSVYRSVGLSVLTTGVCLSDYRLSVWLTDYRLSVCLSDYRLSVCLSDYRFVCLSDYRLSVCLCDYSSVCPCAFLPLPICLFVYLSVLLSGSHWFFPLIPLLLTHEIRFFCAFYISLQFANTCVSKALITVEPSLAIFHCQKEHRRASMTQSRGSWKFRQTFFTAAVHWVPKIIVKRIFLKTTPYHVYWIREI